MGFMRTITGKRAQQKADMILETPRAEVVCEAAQNQSTRTYVGRRQVMVAHWVVLWPIFEVCAGDKVYEGDEVVGTHGGVKRQRRNILVQISRKS